MALLPSSDVAAADWLCGSDLPWAQLVEFGPAGFPAYARVRHLPDPPRPRMHEADAEIDENHPADWERVVAALQVLTGHTRTPQTCFVCIWDGNGTALQGSWIEVPHRRYSLYTCSLAELCSDATTLNGVSIREEPGVAFVWPADRAWCLADDVDPHWTGVGASAEAIAELLSHSWLDAVAADPSLPTPRYDG